jgi:hypothetical protein
MWRWDDRVTAFRSGGGARLGDANRGVARAAPGRAGTQVSDPAPDSCLASSTRCQTPTHSLFLTTMSAEPPAAARELAAGMLRQKAKELFKRSKYAGGWVGEPAGVAHPAAQSLTAAPNARRGGGAVRPGAAAAAGRRRAALQPLPRAAAPRRVPAGGRGRGAGDAGAPADSPRLLQWLQAARQGRQLSQPPAGCPRAAGAAPGPAALPAGAGAARDGRYWRRRAAAGRGAGAGARQQGGGGGCKGL